ncbi:unnamed protein product, partial [Mesorhabditis spiculigera]
MYSTSLFYCFLLLAVLCLASTLSTATTTIGADYEDYDATAEYLGRFRRHYSPTRTIYPEAEPTESDHHQPAAPLVNAPSLHRRDTGESSVLRSDDEPQPRTGPFLVDATHPIYMVVPLPETDDPSMGRNPFRLSIPRVEPIIDLGIEEVGRRGWLPNNSIVVLYRNSQMSDAHGPNVVIDMLVQNKLDIIVGYAYVYALAPVARMCPFWRDKDSQGIPVITPIGLTGNLDDKREYTMMTRINSPYKFLRESIKALWREYEWERAVFLFHDPRYRNKDQSQPSGECYLALATIKYFFKERNQSDYEQHDFFIFNEMYLNDSRAMFRDYLQKGSFLTNVQFQAFRASFSCSDEFVKFRRTSCAL